MTIVPPLSGISRGLLRALAASLLALGAQSLLAAPPTTLSDSPFLREDVAAKKLPPVKDRVPENPLLVAMDGKTVVQGQYGGTLNMLIGRTRDVRMMLVYGYARLVGFDANLKLQPDILESLDVKEDRIFTMKLRKGHRWSDGEPFTTEGRPST